MKGVNKENIKLLKRLQNKCKARKRKKKSKDERTTKKRKIEKIW